MKKNITILFSILLITSCYSNSESSQLYPLPRFNNEATIDLDVRSISVNSTFTPSFRRPNVEHLFPHSLEKVAKVWVEDKLKAVDLTSTNEAIVTIKDASVVEELVKSDKILEKDKLKYKATLYVEIKVEDTNNLSSAQTEIQAWRELSIPYDTPIAQKEKYWNSMVEKLFKDFNAQMTLNIDEYLGHYKAK